MYVTVDPHNNAFLLLVGALLATTDVPTLFIDLSRARWRASQEGVTSPSSRNGRILILSKGRATLCYGTNRCGLPGLHFVALRAKAKEL